MIFKKIANAAAAHFARLVEQPSSPTSETLKIGQKCET